MTINNWSEEANRLYSHCMGLPELNEKQINEQDLRKNVKVFNSILRINLPEESSEFDGVIRRLIAENKVNIEVGEGLYDDWIPWLEAAKQSGEYPAARASAYEQYLQIDCHRTHRILQALKSVSEDILDHMADPRPESDAVSRKGLVMGDVQSGKTQTYLYLMNMAVDYGYRLIIVLTSDNENLRRQTQERVDSDFCGYRENEDGSRIKTKFLEYLPKEKRETSSLTGILGDFGKDSGKIVSRIFHPRWDSKTPCVAVVKKNRYILDALYKWLSEDEILRREGIPVLIIDDECDYASVNTNKPEDAPTAINKRIRDLLSLCKRGSYVAVTATPFANIFIDDAEDEDIFPDNFIYLTPSPSNYIGVDRLFGDLDEPNTQNARIHIIDEIEIGGKPKRHKQSKDCIEHEDIWLPLKHKKDYQLPLYLDIQVEEAIDTFLISLGVPETAMRRASMLVHASRFMRVQYQIAEQIQQHVSNIQNALKFHGNDPHDPAIQALKRVYIKQYSGVMNSNWAAVLSRITTLVSEVEIKLVNSDPEAKIWNGQHNPSEEDSRFTIFVGGDKLSRGLTLPELTVSFFYRQVGAADTLLQMGRWFGYRDGYDQLMRIWLLESAVYDFQYSASALKELKIDIREMKAHGMSPKDFGLQIRTNPRNGVHITSPDKRRNAAEHKGKQNSVDYFNLAGKLVESAILPFGERESEENRQALLKLLQVCADRANAPQALNKSNQGICYTNVAANIITEFLQTYRAGHGDVYFGNQLVTFRGKEREFNFSLAQRYAETQANTSDGNGNFPFWDVVILTNGKGELAPEKYRELIPHWTMTERSSAVYEWDCETFVVSGRNRRLGSRSEIHNYVKNFGKGCPPDFKASSERDYYQYAERPALFIYLLEPKFQTEASVPRIGAEVGVKIVVPATTNDISGKTNRGTAYYYNTVAERQLFDETIQALEANVKDFEDEIEALG